MRQVGASMDGSWRTLVLAGMLACTVAVGGCATGDDMWQSAGPCECGCPSAKAPGCKCRGHAHHAVLRRKHRGGAGAAPVPGLVLPGRFHPVPTRPVFGPLSEADNPTVNVLPAPLPMPRSHGVDDDELPVPDGPPQADGPPQSNGPGSEEGLEARIRGRRSSSTRDGVMQTRLLDALRR